MIFSLGRFRFDIGGTFVSRFVVTVEQDNLDRPALRLPRLLWLSRTRCFTSTALASVRVNLDGLTVDEVLVLALVLLILTSDVLDLAKDVIRRLIGDAFSFSLLVFCVANPLSLFAFLPPFFPFDLGIERVFYFVPQPVHELIEISRAQFFERVLARLVRRVRKVERSRAVRSEGRRESGKWGVVRSRRVVFIRVGSRKTRR